ncbi:Peptide deformylase 1 [Cyphellophora attinorum]|uniref:Peptide deformylase n=1 Tax=Cyphellophora attinorum TaxID=1664694 RepID=A0A0N1P1T9_9EURO|nr:Peptide deformylase 1 [Phialophora attinorum]KPI44307.1 Peptide deformylase 1 [Phialophora attinorum]
MADHPHLLQLVEQDHPVLHQPTQRVTFPLSAADQQLILDMQYSILPPQLKAARAPWDGAAGMAANQWGYDRAIFLWHRDDQPDNIFDAAINPSYEILQDSTPASKPQTRMEGCFSVPRACGKVERVLNIRVKYQDPEGVEHSQVLQGDDARTWMHENDHVDGYLYVKPKYGKCTGFRQFKSKAEAEAHYRQHGE